jgi:hypothetical protein
MISCDYSITVHASHRNQPDSMQEAVRALRTNMLTAINMLCTVKLEFPYHRSNQDNQI